MTATTLIPDSYNGPIKQLPCRVCKHAFCVTHPDYSRLQEVRYCRESSLPLYRRASAGPGIGIFDAIGEGFFNTNSTNTPWICR